MPDSTRFLTKKCRTDDEIEDLKNAVFTNILMKPTGDMTRFVRNMKAIMGTTYQDGFLEEQRDIAAGILEELPEQGKMSTEVIREVVRAKEDAVQALERSMEKTLTKVKKNETKNRPIQLAEKATTFLESMDTNILWKMNDSELQRLARQLDKLEQVIADIRENL